MQMHKGDSYICCSGCTTLWEMLYASGSLQKKVCKKGGLNVLLNILKCHMNNVETLELCCGAIGIILSSQEAFSDYDAPKILNAVKKCRMKYKDSMKIKQSLLGIAREEDTKVIDAILRGVCTKRFFPKCSDDCMCDENVYCPKCCVQQRAFRCYTCDPTEIKLYCETCWERDHQGHKCEEFFYSVRCATE